MNKKQKIRKGDNNMTCQQKNDVNRRLADMYFECRLNTSEPVRYDSARELVGAIEILTTMGCIIGGYQNGKLVSKPYVVDRDDQPAALIF